MRTHADTLYLAGSVVGKVLYVGIDGAATSTKIGLIDADPFTMKLMLQNQGGSVGSLVGSPNGGTPQASMIPLYISSDIGMRLYTTVQSDEMVNVTYVEMTS